MKLFWMFLLAGLLTLRAEANYARFLGTSVADAVEKVMPSVVVVQTERYEEYLGWDFWGNPRLRENRVGGQGSGIIIRKDGYILTNHHVIDDAEQIQVTLADGSKYRAKLVGADPIRDLAVLKVDHPKGATFAALEAGDSDRLRVGEFVIAIGSPFSLASSVTLGIVSQKGRTMETDSAYGGQRYVHNNLIQSDAAINVGNSGGPLVDVDGRMVGINTMVQTDGRSLGNIGIGFAIPVNHAMKIAQALIKDGQVVPAWLGISMQRARSGSVVVIDEVTVASPADKAGLTIGDRLIRIGTHPIVHPRDVSMRLVDYVPGDTVEMVVERNGKERSIKVVAEKKPKPVQW